jgi:hypothetical protein
VHLNHWWLVAGSGKPTQVPEETVRLFPVALVPETAGFAVADGVLVTMEVEAVNLTVDVAELVAVTPAIRCFPTSSLLSTRVFDVASGMTAQLVAALFAGAMTWASHLNHW